MSTPEEIQSDIERTRADVREDVEALQEKVDPRSAAGRRATRVKQTVSDVTDRVMGTAESGAASARNAVTDAPDVVRTRTAGNPLAVGLGAFAVGWLVSSLIPSTQREQEMVRSLQDSDIAQPLQETAQNLVSEAQSQGQQAVHEVAEQAKSSAESLAQSTKQKVTGS
jgi:hypothetical protein